AVNIFAAFVQRDKYGVFRDCGRDRGGLLGDACGWVAGAAFGNFMDIEAAEAELGADVVEALPVGLREPALRSLFQPADGNDDESHEHFPAKRKGLPDKTRRCN